MKKIKIKTDKISSEYIRKAMFFNPLSTVGLFFLDMLFHKKTSIFGRTLVFINGVATAGPSFRGLQERELRWEHFGISHSKNPEIEEILSNTLLRHTWNRTVSGFVCMLVSCMDVENHGIAVVMLGLQKLGSLGVLVTQMTCGGNEELTMISKLQLSYDIKTALICICYGVTLLIRRRQREAPEVFGFPFFRQFIRETNIDTEILIE
mmetsp:Transcript_22808/g.29104  ORF Transcript_22808/g.29104 Transcript_22808/m.29104 type:complete len:207 (-) Transcript_22808:369-989(-)